MNNQITSSLSKETLLQILDNLPTSIFVKDENLRFVFCNKQNQIYIGGGPDQIYGQRDEDFYVGDELEGFIRNDRKVIETGQSICAEEMASTSEGMTRPVLTQKSRLKTLDGKTYIIGTNTDLSALKKREDQYRALAETVPVGVLQFEEDGTLSFANPLLHAYLHKEPGALCSADICEALGQSSEIFPGEAARFECDLNHTDGSSRHVLVISSGWLKLGKGHNRSALVSIVDISENMALKRINEEILRLNRELAQNMQMLKDAQDALVKRGRLEQMGQLTATIAHELRNPLGAVRTSVFLMERKLKDKGMGLEPQIARINNGVTRCDNIITQLLDFSRSKHLDCKSADLDAWLETLIEEEAKRLPSAITLKCVLGLAGRHVPFDAGRLQRAVINLLTNAVEALVGNGDKALVAGAPPPLVVLQTRVAGSQFEISVIDNGPGIAPEHLDKIREPLFTTKSFGTGLGVPAIEQIAVLHGGTLSVQSVFGRGATFTLHLPVTLNQKEAA